MHLLAPTMLEVAPAELAERVRLRFGAELRRAGAFAQIGMLGARACLDAAGGSSPGASPLGVLSCSTLGPAGAFRAAFDDDLRQNAPVMPFTFIAMQPHLAATLLARSRPVARSAHLHLGEDAWPWLLHIAQGWLESCGQVLLGRVEESGGDGRAHRSDWCLVQRAPADGSVRAEVTRDQAATGATTADWIVRIGEWHAGARAPLALRGGGDAWRFTAA